MSNNNAEAWKEIHRAARAEFPDAMNDSRRLQKGRAWMKGEPLFRPPSLIDVMGKIFTHYESERKAGARNRVMNKAMEYHKQESDRRQARHVRAKNSNGRDIAWVLFWIAFFSVWFLILRGCAL